MPFNIPLLLFTVIITGCSINIYIPTPSPILFAYLLFLSLWQLRRTGDVYERDLFASACTFGSVTVMVSRNFKEGPEMDNPWLPTLTTCCLFSIAVLSHHMSQCHWGFNWKTAAQRGGWWRYANRSDNSCHQTSRRILLTALKLSRLRQDRCLSSSCNVRGILSRNWSRENGAQIKHSNTSGWFSKRFSSSSDNSFCPSFSVYCFLSLSLSEPI